MRKLFLFILLVGLTFTTQAQCYYVLDMQDSWGDGWNSARIDATMNGLFVGSFECFGSSTIDSVYSFAQTNIAPSI